MNRMSNATFAALFLAVLMSAFSLALLLYVQFHEPQRPLTDYWIWKAPHSDVTVQHGNGWECLYGEEPVGFINGTPTALTLCRKGERLVAGFGFDGGKLP